MNIYVGVTDTDWYRFLSSRNIDELNFWVPSCTYPKKVAANDLFLFKLKQRDGNRIVGGGFFVGFVVLPIFLAWESFGEKNGVATLGELEKKIHDYQRNKGKAMSNEVGCAIVTEPFWFQESDQFVFPGFSLNVPTGITYSTDEENGAWLLTQVKDRLSGTIQTQKGDARYTESLTRHRLGQGAFRACVTAAYNRKCSITGEKTLVVLEAAHIRPYASDGPHETTNGLLLKSDFHTLFDAGYITVTPDYHVEVSGRLHEDFGNGRDYYRYHGSSLLLPEKKELQPKPEYLRWHNEHVFLPSHGV